MRTFYTLFLVWVAGSALAVDNPVSVVLDGSVVRHNGAYFGMAGATNGTMLVSGNLLDWNPVASVLEPSVTGPYELLCRNGFFSLYVQDQAYAAATQPTGPFSNLRPVDFSGENLRLFQDPGGGLFSVYRTEGSKKEGELWMQLFVAPWKPDGHPRQLLDGRRGMWDSTEIADLGEPEMMVYRGNYYLFYASNHANPRTGLREIGWAVNEKSERLENVDRQADPLVMRNVERLARTYRTILPSGEYTGWKVRYSFKPPVEGWEQLGFDMKSWRTGIGAFGFPFTDRDANIHAGRTEWKGEHMWVRREFNLLGAIPKTPVLNIRYEGSVQVFLNGKQVFESSDPMLSYGNFNLSEAASGLFQVGENVLAVHAVAGPEDEFRFLDFGLFDAGAHSVEPTVYNPDAPHVVEGPNGFEKWLAYQAYWNGTPGTGLDRIFFYGEEMVVDGPTTTNTPGYHPPPAPPTFSTGFPSGSQEWRKQWLFLGGEWVAANGVLRQALSKGTARAFLRRKPAKNYLFETYIRFPKAGGNVVGVVAFRDARRELSITINPAQKSWGYQLEPGGQGGKYKLPKEFKSAPDALHRLRITKNGGNFDVMLDQIKLTLEHPIETPLTGAGVPGLFCRNAAAEFDGVAYTIGWDEHDDRITGWGTAADGSPSGGEWRHRKERGLEQRKHSEPGRAFKGDLLGQYEFTANLRTEKLEEGKERLYGVFPVFADRKNYLKAMIDTRKRELIVSGMRKGKPVGPFTKSLKRHIPHRHLYDKATSYRTVAAWLYALRSESIISGLDVRWLEGKYPILQQEFYLPADEILIRHANLERKREPVLWEDRRFFSADEPKPTEQVSGVLNPLIIREETGNHIGFSVVISRDIYAASDPKASDRPYYSSRPQEVLVRVEVESSYFFRCIKLKDRVIIELNGQPMLEVEGAWPDSQVGLLTEGQPTFFNGITLIHLPEE